LEIKVLNIGIANETLLKIVTMVHMT